MVKNVNNNAINRLLAAAPRTPKRKPAQSNKGIMRALCGERIPPYGSATNVYQASQLIPPNSKTPSNIFDIGNLRRNSSGFASHVRRKGDKTKIAIAQLPHQTFQDCAKE